MATVTQATGGRVDDVRDDRLSLKEGGQLIQGDVQPGREPTTGSWLGMHLSRSHRRTVDTVVLTFSASSSWV